MQQSLLLITIFAVAALVSTHSTSAQDPASTPPAASRISSDAYSVQLATAQRFLRENGIEPNRLQVDDASKTFSLNLSKTAVNDLKPLAGLSALRELNLNETKINDLKPLVKLTGLNKLLLYGTPINDISPLQTLTALAWLNFGKTQVRDLKPLAGLTALKDLELHWTPVTDLKPLSGLKALEVLNLYKVPVNDLTPLHGLAKLKIVNLGETGADQKAMAAFSKHHPKILLLVTDPAVF